MERIILDREELYDKYYIENLTYEEMSKFFDVSVHTIRKNMNQYGFSSKCYKKDRIDKDVLEEYYINKKFSIRDIAKKLDVSEFIVRISLKENNIKMRKKYWKSKYSKNGKYVPCEVCGKLIYRKKYRLEKFSNFYCSWECEKIHQSILRRSTDSNWRNVREYKKWGKAVYKRDGKKCRLCGSKKKINAHHIIEAQHDNSLIYVISNGITLCEKCHIKIHKNNSINYVESLQKVISVENQNIGENPETDNPEATR